MTSCKDKGDGKHLTQTGQRQYLNEDLKKEKNSATLRGRVENIFHQTVGNVGCYSRCSRKALEGFKELKMCSDLHFQTSSPAAAGRVGSREPGARAGTGRRLLPGRSERPQRPQRGWGQRRWRNMPRSGHIWGETKSRI